MSVQIGINMYISWNIHFGKLPMLGAGESQLKGGQAKRVIINAKHQRLLFRIVFGYHDHLLCLSAVQL